MTTTIRSILFVVFLSCAGIVSAANTALSKQQKIEQMLASLKLDRIIESGISECIESMLNAYYAPEKVVEKSGDYKGMTPKSADWPQVQAAFHRFAEKSCSGAGVERTRKVYIEWYDKNFTEEDLDAIIRFQQSPAGRALATAQENFTRFLSKATSDANLKAQEEAGVDFRKEVDAISDRQRTCKQQLWWMLWLKNPC